MRVGTASVASHHQDRKRTRDDVVSPEGASQFRAPQSSTTVPSQESHGQRKNITCYGCGKTGHIQAHCRSTRDRKSVV